MWDYPMEYVFYGIATIALWTIINVFIEMTTLDGSEEEKKVVHKGDEAPPSSTDGGGRHRSRGIMFDDDGGEKALEGGEKAQEGGEKAREGGETCKEGGDTAEENGETANEGVEDAPPPPPPLETFPAALSYEKKEERSDGQASAEEVIVKEERATIDAAPSTCRGGISWNGIDQEDDKGASPADADASPKGSGEGLRGAGGGAGTEDESLPKEVAAAVGDGLRAWKISGEKFNSPTESLTSENDYDVTGIYQVVGRKRVRRDWTDDSVVSYGENGVDTSREDKASYRKSYHAEDTSQEYLIKKYFGGELKSQWRKSIIPNDADRTEYSHEERNLLKNNCGQNDLEFWDLKQERHGWVVEANVDESDKPPSRNQYGEPIPEFDGYTTSFETVNRMCKKEQIVDLVAEGFTAEYLDEVQPPIQVSDWITIRTECRSTYELRVKLLSQEKETISDYQHDHSFSSIKETKWKKVSHTFKEYGPGARYVLFSHGAVKWYGKRGCRMSGAAVRLLCTS